MEYNCNVNFIVCATVVYFFCVMIRYNNSCCTWATWLVICTYGKDFCEHIDHFITSNNHVPPMYWQLSHTTHVIYHTRPSTPTTQHSPWQMCCLLGHYKMYCSHPWRLYKKLCILWVNNTYRKYFILRHYLKSVPDSEGLLVLDMCP